MRAFGLVRLSAVAATLVLGLSAAALAAPQPATTSGPANLRQGPGTSFPIITQLDAGTDVLVEACTGTWCAVKADDGEGFVAKSLLDFDSAANDDSEDTPPPVADDAQVCFYQGPDFSDANFCVSPGDQDDHIPGSFNNAIESILISGGASVEVCTGSGMSGQCASFDHSVKKLPFSLRDKITSYAVDPDTSDDSATPDDGSDDAGDSGGGGFTLN